MTAVTDTSSSIINLMALQKFPVPAVLLMLFVADKNIG